MLRWENWVKRWGGYSIIQKIYRNVLPNPRTSPLIAAIVSGSVYYNKEKQYD